MGHARYIGRVGGLAVALGVGVAVATTPGVAWADEGSAGSDASASTSTADTTSGTTVGGTTTGSLTGAAAGSSADPSADGGDDSADAGESAESGASTGGMQVDASGGAITSTTPGSAGAAADEDVDAERMAPIPRWKGRQSRRSGNQRASPVRISLRLRRLRRSRSDHR